MLKSLLRSSLVGLLVIVAFVYGRAQSSPNTPPPVDSSTAQPTPTPPPLSAAAKMKHAACSAFLDPLNHAFTGLGAAIIEAGERDLPHKETDDRVADGLTRFAINSATRATRTMLGSGVYPVLFKQDPRYYPSFKKGFGSRAAHAASRVFVTYGDDGRAQPNYSRLAGSFSAAALANIWERSTPGHDRIGTRPTLRRFGYAIGFDMLNNVVFREFWPDIMRKLGKK